LISAITMDAIKHETSTIIAITQLRSIAGA
jgi:hypothetical protein